MRRRTKLAAHTQAALEALVEELQEIIEWTKIERAPLRQLELDSIAQKIKIGKAAIAAIKQA